MFLHPKHYRKEQAEVISRKLKLQALSRYVPEAPQLDRLLRYEATLERGIDRTLNHLERAQRMRRGEPVKPPINLNISK